MVALVRFDSRDVHFSSLVMVLLRKGSGVSLLLASSQMMRDALSNFGHSFRVYESVLWSKCDLYGTVLLNRGVHLHRSK